MPLKRCESNGKPGWKFGDSGTCYTYTKDDDASEKAAKKKAVKQSIAIGGGKAPRDLEVEPELIARAVREYAARDYLAEIRDNDDGTFDLIGVEVLSTGGPVHGVGSPPEGDFWTVDDLKGMEQADRELGEEIMPPNKLGHPDEQTLVANSIDAGELPGDGEMPAVGWLEDVRVDGQKLVADVKKVPKLVAELIEKGAWRTRSVELSKVTSQKSGKTYDWVVTGLAWLGGKVPAVKTLGDVVALYEGDEAERRRVVSYAVGDVVWDPAQSFGAIRRDVEEALNGPGPYGGPPRYWVRDVSADGKALVCEGYDDNDAWVATWTRDSDGTITVAPRSDWVDAEQTWVETSKQYERSGDSRGRSDTRSMPETKFTDEQRRKFADATGLDEEKVTDEMLANAGVVEEKPAEEPDPAKQLEADERVRALEQTAKDADERSRKLEEELRVEKRRSFVEGAIKDAKVEPGQREELETLWDKDPDTARKFVDGLKPREDLLRELGSDEEEPSDEETRKQRDLEWDDSFERLYGERPMEFGRAR